LFLRCFHFLRTRFLFVVAVFIGKSITNRVARTEEDMAETLDLEERIRVQFDKTMAKSEAAVFRDFDTYALSLPRCVVGDMGTVLALYRLPFWADKLLSPQWLWISNQTEGNWMGTENTFDTQQHLRRRERPRAFYQPFSTAPKEIV
jgi:hypothetical protein